jgi:hypothetical protein
VGEVNPDPKNPRTIDPTLKAELGRFQKEFGDLGGIVYNRRTGQLVGGHQRLSNLPKNAVIDWSAPNDDGEIWGMVRGKGHEWAVRAVDWDLETQRRACIVANNVMIQGRFEMEGLAEVLAEVSYDTVGFTELDIEQLAFTDEEVDRILGDNHAEEVIQKLTSMGKRDVDQVEGGSFTMQDGTEVPLAGVEGAFKDSLGTKIRKRQKKGQEHHGFYRIIVCRTDEQAQALMDVLGLQPNERYIDGEWLLDLFKE